jgi:hypothetical protein
MVTLSGIVKGHFKMCAVEWPKDFERTMKALFRPPKSDSNKSKD